MHKALIVKELRESAGIVALAVLVLGFIYLESTGRQFSKHLSTGFWEWNTGLDYGIPFVSRGAVGLVSFVAACFAVALGLKQTIRELSQGTYCFMLQRPMDRNPIFGVKLAVGVSLLLLATGAMLCSYALWAATPGNHDSPFYWSMTVPAWRIWFSMSLVYLGAFLTGIRPGHWFGSRLAPLVTSGLIVFTATMLPWWWAGVLLVFIADGLFVVSILHSAQERDY
jgi:hypothetical protein